MATAQLSTFSQDGQYLAYSSPDGTLRIYECASGQLKQEYSSASHLSATTSALCWSHNKIDQISLTKKRKRQSLESTAQEDLQLIALGTTTGSINLYSFSKGVLQNELTGGHSQKVNDVVFHISSPELFSVSDDQNIVHWDLKRGKVKHKWKADDAAVTAVCQCSKNRLASAAHTVKLWDLDTYSVLRSFTGHGSAVFRLLPVSLPGPDGDSDAHYFLSAAIDDRHISVWSYRPGKEREKGGNKEKNAVASFSLPDEPTSLSYQPPSSASQALMLAVITKKGILHVFEQVLNGRKKKPVMSSMTVRGATAADSQQSETPVAVLASNLDQGKISLAFGNPMKPQFENVAFDTSRPEVVVRLQPPSAVMMKEEYSQVKRPEISKHMTTLKPSDSQPMQATKDKNKKRLRKSSVSDLNLEERLHAMSDEQTPAEPGSTVRQPPVANTLARLLQQGLQSSNRKILTDVFQETNEAIVRNTVKRLPATCIVQLIKEIEKGMNGHAQHACNLSKWISALIACHTSYILSVPEIINTMNSLYQTLASRQKFYPKVLELKGRLELVKQKHPSDTEEDEGENAPLLVYQDESDSEGSEDSMVIDGAALESEDENWEDLSDMEDS